MTISETKQLLLDLIEELKIPITPDDAMNHMENLTDEEVQALIPSFEYVKAYQDNLSQEAEHADPDRYSLFKATYEKEARELHQSFLNKIEEVQMEYDNKADDLEKEISEAALQLRSDQEEELSTLEKVYRAILPTDSAPTA